MTHDMDGVTKKWAVSGLEGTNYPVYKINWRDQQRA